ncbi:MAG: PRTRC system protein A [Rhizobium sp.]|nr:MAG: PRTRC system protein A [Rhizobium sp.]
MIDAMYSDSRDRASFSATPALMMPRYGKLPEIEVGHVRFLVGRGGIYVESRSYAVHGCLQIASAQQLPFGDVQPFFHTQGGPIPQSLRQELLRQARAALPNEYAALVLWQNGEYRLHTPKVLSASPHRIHYSTADFDPLEVVIDVHSHGVGPAFFSGTDNQDDLASPMLLFQAMVMGRLDREVHEEVARMVINGRSAVRLDELADRLDAPRRGHVALEMVGVDDLIEGLMCSGVPVALIDPY